MRLLISLSFVLLLLLAMSPTHAAKAAKPGSPRLAMD